MGLFKGIKDMANMTKQAKEMQAQQQEQAGYKPGLGRPDGADGRHAEPGQRADGRAERPVGRPEPAAHRGDRGAGRDRRHGHPGPRRDELQPRHRPRGPRPGPRALPGRQPVHRPRRRPDRPRSDAPDPGRPVRPVEDRDRLEPGRPLARARRGPARRSRRGDRRLRPRLRRHRAAATRSPSSSGWRSCATPVPSPTPSSSSRRRASSAADAGPVAPEVEFLWWSECPSWERALADLRAAMVENGLDPGSIERARDRERGPGRGEGFPGSPTIRVNGEDIAEPAEGMPRGLVCRVYLRRDRRVSPLPDPLDVREALAAATAVDSASLSA